MIVTIRNLIGSVTKSKPLRKTMKSGTEYKIQQTESECYLITYEKERIIYLFLLALVVPYNKKFVLGVFFFGHICKKL